MKIARWKQRGGPLYAHTGGEVVSLVPEVAGREVGLDAARGLALRLLAPSSVYVIDESGVHRLALANRRAGLVALGLVSLLGPFQYWLIGRRGRR